MKALIVGAALLALVPAVASAQSRTHYDWRTGNSYRTTPNYDGSSTVRGFNTQTGSTWNTRVQPNGNMRGTDSRGNQWNYNARSGSYVNSNGTTCFGKGYGRVCN